MMSAPRASTGPQPRLSDRWVATYFVAAFRPSASRPSRTSRFRLPTPLAAHRRSRSDARIPRRTLAMGTPNHLGLGADLSGCGGDWSTRLFRSAPCRRIIFSCGRRSKRLDHCPDHCGLRISTAARPPRAGIRGATRSTPRVFFWRVDVAGVFIRFFLIFLTLVRAFLKLLILIAAPTEDLSRPVQPVSPFPRQQGGARTAPNSLA